MKTTASGEMFFSVIVCQAEEQVSWMKKTFGAFNRRH